MLDLSKIQVLYEDNHLIAVNKPAGWLVHADETGDRTLADYVKAYIKLRYNKPGDVFLGIIHRLDRPVSGLTIFARTSKGLSRMNALFKQRDVQKTYLAITDQRPQPLMGTLKHFLSKDRQKNVAKAYESLSNRARSAQAKKAILQYEMIGELENKHLIKVEPETGRPHQIRVQLAQIGCPIFGDVKYGSPFTLGNGSIALHSTRLSFLHPVKREPVNIHCLPPENELWNLFRPIVADYLNT